MLGELNSMLNNIYIYIILLNEKKNQLVLHWFAESSMLCIACHVKNLLYISH